MIASVATPAFPGAVARQPSILVEPPPDGYTGSLESFQGMGQALALAAGPLAGLALGGYAGLATGVGAAVAGALALGVAGSAGGFLAGQYSDLLNGMSGRYSDHYRWGLAAGTIGGAATGAILGACLSSPILAGTMALTCGAGAAYWTMLALGR